MKQDRGAQSRGGFPSMPQRQKERKREREREGGREGGRKKERRKKKREREGRLPFGDALHRERERERPSNHSIPLSRLQRILGRCAPFGAASSLGGGGGHACRERERERERESESVSQ